MACLPEARAVFRSDRPLEGASAKLARDLAETFGLLLHTSRAAVEFHKKHRRLRQRELGIDIAGFHLQCIEELDAGNRYARLNRQDSGIAAGFDCRKWADA